MTFTNAIRTCLRKYVTFSGRASRPEYWWFFLAVFLGSIVFNILDSALFGTTTVEVAPGKLHVKSNGPLASIFTLATFIPMLSAGWRRMHDTGKSGLYLLYPLLVLVGMAVFAGFIGGFETVLSGNLFAALSGAGAIVLLIAALIFLISPLLVIWWLTRPTQPGSNEYGPHPSEVNQ